MTITTAGLTAKGSGHLVKEAMAQIENLNAAQVKTEMKKGNVAIIDVREPEE